jgi:predicted nucleic acid-binding protein
VPRRAVIDSGPLVALFDKDDQHHARALQFIQNYQGQLYTTVAVLTEVTHLLDFSVRVQLDFLNWVIAGAVEVEDLDKSSLLSIYTLVKKYSDLPADFADASLVAIADKLSISNIVSMDSDFLVYRTQSGSYLKSLMEEG